MERERRFIDDLPAVKISHLRALDLVTAETTEFTIRLGDIEQTVVVKLLKFPNGGSWSLFVCPTCGRRARVLRSLNGAVVCQECCLRRGVYPRSWPMSVGRRAEVRVAKLRAMLESDKPLRLKPSTMGGTMERRARHEEALQRCLLVLKRHDLAALERAVGKKTKE